MKFRLFWKPSPKTLPVMAEVDETIFERVSPSPGDITERLEKTYDGEIESFTPVSDEEFVKWQNDQKPENQPQREYDDPAN